MQEEKTTTGNDVNKVITVCGYDEIYYFMTNNHEFVYNGNNEFWFGTALITVYDYYLNVRVYTDSINRICVTSVALNYDDFVLRYRARDNDIKLLSRNNDRKISDTMYISIKEI